jgi:UDP-glucose 6-dehydrogenase
MNILFDYAQALSVPWSAIKSAIGADPDNGPTYTNPVHKSGRGAGGRCFIKDMAAFRAGYEKQFGKDAEGVMLLRALEKKNTKLLVDSHKDIDLLQGVYGKKITHRHTKSR